ncbi:MAG: prevent-host-death protein [Caulobacteraceae bacterium]|nr:prevent-host-death protein [Caulobacteraceae bacterium]
MEISLTEAKAHLTDLVRRAEAGEEVVLTRHGHPTVRLEPVRRAATPVERSVLIRRVQEMARGKILPGPDAAHSADFLYDENGLPA